MACRAGRGGVRQRLVIGNQVIAATENDTVYALSARDGQVVWSVSLGQRMPGADLGFAGRFPSAAPLPPRSTPSEWSATVTPTDFSCPRSRATRSSDRPSVVPCRSAPV